MMRAMPLDQTFDAVVPVPMHWRRRLERGFNQAELLANHAAKAAGIPLLRALKRKKRTAAQASLTSAERRGNLANAFEAAKPEKIRGARLLLIDDVLTSGATAGRCAMVLKKAGATQVSVLTLARADRLYWAGTLEPKSNAAGVS